MNLGELRNAIFAQSDWAPKKSVEAKTRLNEFINRAYQQLALEAPFLFFQSELEFATQEQVISNDEVTDAAGVMLDRLICVDEDHDSNFAPTVRAAEAVSPPPDGDATKYFGNPWVWKLNLNGDAVAWGSFKSQGGILPKTDGSWDGRRIDIGLEPRGGTGGETTWFQTRIRTIWKIEKPDDEGEDEKQYYFSLWNPVPIEKYKFTIEPNQIGPFKYRIYTDRYYLPDDFIQAQDFLCQGKDSAEDTPRQNMIDVVFQYTADSYALDDQFRTIKGRPYKAFRREHFQLPAPNTAPIAEHWEFVEDPTAADVILNENFYWSGPEPAGEFSYIVTYTWGKRDIAFSNPGPGAFDSNYTNNATSQWVEETGYEPTYPGGLTGPPYDVGAGWPASSSRFREPLWESAPSPPSQKITVMNQYLESLPVTGPRFPATLVRLPNIEFMLGMLGQGSYEQTLGGGGSVQRSFKRAFAGRSGFKVRIYRRRHSADFSKYQHLPAFGGAIYDSLALNTGLTVGPPAYDSHPEPEGHIEISDAYYLLAEVDTMAATRGYFIDNGQLHPDYSRRLRDTHGYQSMCLYPIPDQRYVIRVNCIRRPERLIDDADVPYVQAEACDILVSKAMELWYEMNGNESAASNVRSRYQNELFILAKRYGDLKPQAQNMRRTPSRAIPGAYSFRRWYSTDYRNTELFPVVP
jgi:hypothetical protein